jgi:hypothetical protein
MRPRPSTLGKATAAVTSVVLLASCAGCEARVYGSPANNPEGPQLIVVAPKGPADATPEAPPNQPAAAALDGLQGRAQQATAEAAKKGADIGFMVLDRETGQEVSAGHTARMATASVVKLFIADDLLLRQPDLSPEDRKSLDVMLRSSDDSAAEVFWNRGGGNAIVNRVAARYGLSATSPPGNGRWWNTITSAQDLVRYYDMLLNGSGGLPPERANIIVNNLAQSTPTAIDGTQPGGVYPQRFGIPEGLYAEPVAVKQGWMCCIGSDWMHMSTGIIGSGRRYVMVIYSLQPADAATARATITQAVKTMFPGGRV